MIELKSWSTLKAFCVYRKVFEDHCYEVKGHGPFNTPNPKFSNVRYETSRWRIFPVGDFKLTKFLPCVTDISKVKDDLHSSRGRLDNVLGNFIQLHKGPRAYIPTVQGYFVQLADKNGTYFFVLVWHVKMGRGRSKFNLLECEPGDTVLVNCVRETHGGTAPYTNRELYSLTSICPPLVNSQCVSAKRIQELNGKSSYKKANVSNMRDNQQVGYQIAAS